MAGSDHELPGGTGVGHRRRSMEPGRRGVQTGYRPADAEPDESPLIAPVGQFSGLRRAGSDLLAGLVPLLLGAIGAWYLFDLPALYFADVLGMYALLAALLVYTLPNRLPPPGIGMANRVTLFRATLVLPIVALALHAPIPDAGARWWIVVVGTVAMTLDAVDGAVARRSGGMTRFGARFDMELDAFLLLTLSVLVWWSGQAGAWVILIGLLRYAFVAAGWIWRALATELPASFRRKAICVVQGIVLLTCLGPIIPASVATPIAAAALALLIWSFAVDVRWLRQRGAQHLMIVAALVVSLACGPNWSSNETHLTVEELTARAERGDDNALFDLAARFHSADGVQRDNITSYMWYALAEEFLTSEERYEAARMQLVLDPDMFRHEIDESHRLARIWKAEFRAAAR